jgi:hypothetical protein
MVEHSGLQTRVRGAGDRGYAGCVKRFEQRLGELDVGSC